MNKFSKRNYIKLLRDFKKNGYSFKNFYNFKNKNDVILRHDIDFDLSAAEEIAKIERKENIRSNFFFMVTSSFYNPTSKFNIDTILRIEKLGHYVGLHFNIHNYKDIARGLKIEKNIFENIVNHRIKMMSIHRPGKFLNKSIKFNSIRHAYESSYFKEIKYFSDSGGSFKYGNPVQSQEFRNKKSMQLLIHPIWWVARGNTPSEKIKYWVQNKLHFFQREIISNCKSYDKKKLLLK